MWWPWHQGRLCTTFCQSDTRADVSVERRVVVACGGTVGILAIAPIAAAQYSTLWRIGIFAPVRRHIRIWFEGRTCPLPDLAQQIPMTEWAVACGAE